MIKIIAFTDKKQKEFDNIEQARRFLGINRGRFEKALREGLPIVIGIENWFVDELDE